MVDDGSTDNGEQDLHRIVSGDSRFILLSNESLKTWPGPASARNFGLSSVKTPLVAFCDVDDLWHPQKLELQLAFHFSNQLDLSVTAYARFSQHQLDDHHLSLFCPPKYLTLENLIGRNPIPMLTVILSTQLARNGFQQVAHEDFLFWLELFRAHPSLRYGCLPLLLSYYCVHPANHSRHKALMPLWSYQVFRRFGLSPLSSLHSLLRWLLSHLTLQLHITLRHNILPTSLVESLQNPPFEVSS